MAKFCTKCGKKLEDGKTCDCAKKEVKVNKEEVSVASGSNVNASDYVNSYIDMIKGIFVKPIDTIKKYATGSQFILGIISVLINSIVFGILIYCLLNEGASGLLSLMGYGSMGSLFGLNVEIPFIKTFLYGFIFMLVWFVVAALMIYVIAGAILKDKIDFKQSTALVGTVAVFTTITNILSIILVYLSMKVMFIVLLIALVFYLVYLYHGLAETTKVDKNKLAYVFVPAVSVATFVMVYILPKILF